MTNRSSSKKHGMAGINGRRKKSKLSKRYNKATLNQRKSEARAAWQEMLKGS